MIADPVASPPRRRRGLAVLPWAITVLALCVAGFSTARWLDLQGHADDREAVAVAANTFLVDLVHWDASDGLADTVAALRERGTGRFLEQAESLFGGPIGDELEVAQAVSEGQVEELFVQSLDGGRAEVFAVVRQSVRSTLTDGPERSVRQVIMQLEQVGGAWRIENLELPELIQQPAGEGEG